MSIVRVGLSETKKFAEGYEAIFGKKRSAPARKGRANSSKGAARKVKKGRR